jgi:hypothetical protein
MRLPVLAVATLATVALASACGSSNGGLIPTETADSLSTDLTNIQAGVEASNCSVTAQAIETARIDFENLPSSISAKLRSQLTQGFNTLVVSAELKCQQSNPSGPTGPSSSTSSSTSTSSTTTTSTTTTTTSSAATTASSTSAATTSASTTGPTCTQVTTPNGGTFCEGATGPTSTNGIGGGGIGGGGGVDGGGGVGVPGN